MTARTPARRARSALVRVWFYPAERALLDRVAAARGVTLSRWIREVLIRAAHEQQKGSVS